MPMSSFALFFSDYAMCFLFVETMTKMPCMLYICGMTAIEKFRSDVERSIKHNRAENNGRYDAGKACDYIQNLFVRNCVVSSGIARAIVFYWRDSYIDRSEDFANEPTSENIDRLCAFLSFLNGADEGEEILSEDDLHELSDAIDDEAETMPLEQLQTLMGKLVDRGAL